MENRSSHEVTGAKGQGKKAGSKERRYQWDRRADDRRRGERRAVDQRAGERRLEQRRTDLCPSCDSVLTAAYYCRNCKVRIIKIRHSPDRRVVRQ
jgi:hypothetical protein